MSTSQGFDQSILKKINSPSEKERAFKAILSFFDRKVYYQVRRMVLNHDDANDIVQNVFIKVWLHLDEFRGDSAFSTWLFRIASNETLNYIASQKRRQHLSIDSGLSHEVEQMQSHNGFSGNEIQLKLHHAIQKLPPKQRMVFNLKYFDELPYHEMSRILGTSEGALKASYHHAVKKIENFLVEN